MIRRYNFIGLALFAYLFLLAIPALQAQVPLPWGDDFEAYANGTVLNGQNGWSGWNNSVAAAATTTTAQAPSSSLEIEGSDDALAFFAAATTGQWVIRAKQYIPSTMTGTAYFILLNQYDHGCASCNWSAQVNFSGGTMTDDGSLTSQSYITDQWVDIVVVIDLDADTQQFLYNGVPFYSGVWAGHISGGGSTAIAALNLFANNSTSVFYDDISISQVAQVQPLPWGDNFEAYANGTLLNGQNGWAGFGNVAGAAARTTTAQAPSSSLEIEGSDDAVVTFSGATTGQWVVRAKQFIPSTMTGTAYFILLNQYDHACAPCNWSTEVAFGGGTMSDDGSATSQAYIADQWVDIAVEIDLDADTQQFLYNGIPFYSGEWAGYISGGGSTAIAALNLFANGSTSVFYDDISISQVALPVELTSFDALANESELVLAWSTASETNNAGFSIQQDFGSNVFGEIGYVEGHGTTDEAKNYRFTVNDLDPGLHRFRLKQIDFDGAFEYSSTVEATVTVPDRFLIEPAYPNPFNPSTTIRFAVAVEQHVEVTLVNAIGQLVQTLHSGPVAANEMQQLTVDAGTLPSGTYLVHFEGNGLSATEQIVLVK